MVGIAVIGDSEFVLGFKLAGIKDTFAGGDVHGAIRKLASEKRFSIIVVRDEDYRKLPQAFREALSESVEPVIIPVGRREQEDIREKIKRAIGVDLYRK
ncbi:MAG: V-type ATP synthase subunit F [Candidatus Thermoplasmatota archaeon]|nr:V-type ATP synthase subunit F [Candidatus Thermoplasmatota archaeon]